MAYISVLTSDLKTSKSQSSRLSMASVSEAIISVLVGFSLSILSHSLKSRSMPLSSVTLPYSSGLQLLVPAKPNYR